jgi:hypothetical protein
MKTLSKLYKTFSFLLSVFFLFGLQWNTAFAASNIEIVTVQVEGKGANRQFAIDNGLVQAISQVNGLRITEQAQLITQINNVTVTTQMQSAILNNNAIKSWKIISEKKADDFYIVKLSVDVPKFKPSLDSKRLKIAIVPFRISNEVGEKKMAGSLQGNLTTELENFLTQTSRFTMLDRSFLSDQSNELAFINNASANINEYAKLGNRLGADYLIVGSIESSSNNRSERKSRVSDKVIVSSSSFTKLTFRVIDITTSQIKFADSLSLTNGDAQNLAKKIGNQIIESIFPIRIISANVGGVILGQGGGTIAIGDKFTVYQLGKVLKDPYTSESLGQEEIDVSLIEVTNILPKTSNAKIISSKLDIMKLVDKEKLIIRPYREAVAEPLNNKPIKTQKDKSIENLEKESKKDW